MGRMRAMRVRLLLGPAGSGKSFRCLTEVREALLSSQDGLPLVLVAPKQTTYQWERQLLAEPGLPGYTRLHILSFERLAHLVFERVGGGWPEMLDEEGRLMVLRALLARRREELKLFRASARLTGFAAQLSQVLGELQRNEQTPEGLRRLAEQVRNAGGLALKLEDLALLLGDYLSWLETHHLQDADCLLSRAAERLGEGAAGEKTVKGLKLDNLWVDGFGEFSRQEMRFIAALLPYCGEATVTFCLDGVPSEKDSWLSNWSVARQSFEDCRKIFGALPEAEVRVEILGRKAEKTRFSSNPVLSHLEAHWAEPELYAGDDALVAGSLRMVTCANPEAEATVAAREILRHVRAGGRYRDVSVLVRKLEGYHQPLQRIFSRYELPFFLDRRESVAHHPLAELTRNALRTVAFQWRHDDWFAALKTGLAPVGQEDIDRLENETLARGWKGATWAKPIEVRDEPVLNEWLAGVYRRALPPFQRLAARLARAQNRPTGPQLAAAVRELWGALKAEEQLEEWAGAEPAGRGETPGRVHATVWEQMNKWLGNVELAFANEALALREWLPILDAGLANLSVGVIPPAIDQVLVGASDRSRNPDVKLAIVLGLNEGIFPALPQMAALLTERDREELSRLNVLASESVRRQMGRERYHGYIACTRARERLVLTSAVQDASGAQRNPSPFLSRVRLLFPSLESEKASGAMDWRESEHVSELIGPLLSAMRAAAMPGEAGAGGAGQRSGELPVWAQSSPAIAEIFRKLQHLKAPEPGEGVSRELAARLYGPVLRTSVSRMERFAACPFKFFVHSGMRAEERKRFELDVREQGSFQHEVLAFFHQELREEGKRWRDITPSEARERVGRIARALATSYREGLLEASDQTRFMARVMTESLQDFVEVLAGWMRQQYRFDPWEVEMPFGFEDGGPAWRLELGPGEGGGKGFCLELQGRIDRIDLFQQLESEEAYCVVVDYKSSQKQLDALLIEHGVQLQLLTYLSVLRHWPEPRKEFGVERLIPAGVFYVNLRGMYERGRSRRETLSHVEAARREAYRHTGRFDARVLRLLDSRQDACEGDQFNYRLTKSGEINKSSKEALATEAFEALLDSVEQNLKRMGQAIFAGEARVDPYRKGTSTACEQCDYRPICRIDPWTHIYRVLKKGE